MEHPTVLLDEGVRMPRLGFGTARVPDEDAATAVRQAIESGYRSIDTASSYDNERGVGRGISDSAVPRDDLFVTTKLWQTDHGFEPALAALDASLDRLGLDHVDLYLVHWPAPDRGLYVETWSALEKLRQEGLTRAIGVSNFLAEHLDAVLSDCGVVPAVNQIELHPRFQQRDLRAFHDRHGVVTEAWSPLGEGSATEEPVVRAVAERLGATPAQVVLAWHLHHDVVVIPKTVSPDRMRANLRAAELVLDAHDMAALDALEAGKRLGPHPGDPLFN